MLLLLILASIVIVLVPGYSQPVSVEVELTEIRAGTISVTVSNATESMVTAVVVTSRVYDVKGNVRSVAPKFRDTRVDLDRGQPIQPLEPGRTWEFLVPAGPPGDQTAEVEVRAVLLADGTAEGDPVWIRILHDRRVGTHEALQGIVGLLIGAEARGDSQSVIDEEMRELKRSLRQNLELDPTKNVPVEESIPGRLLGQETAFALAGILSASDGSGSGDDERLFRRKISLVKTAADTLLARLGASPLVGGSSR